MHARRKLALQLTKTGYLRYLKCPPEFWLEYHHPLLYAPEFSLEYEHLRQQGYEVERLVRTMRRFQPDDHSSVDFQRTFQSAELGARGDIVVTDRATGETDIYEVKSSSSIKPEHYDDVTFQRIAAEKSGAKVRSVFLITLNSEYVRNGDIDVEELFTVTDVTEETTTRRSATEAEIANAFEYLKRVPVATLAEYCTQNKLDCSFIKLSFPDLPPYTVFDISYLKHDKRRQLLRDGVIDITDVPDNFRLSPRQQSQVEAAKTGEVRIDREKIAQRAESWEYPLHFLDYETLAYAIPQFDGIRPFQQMCFQYSLHTLDRPGGELRHSEFLSRGDDNPPLAVAEHLREAMAGDIGTVFVWYEPFEKGRNDEMAEMFPDLAPFLKEVNAKTIDLMAIFADDLYIHPEFKGKTSIKKVLPVLVPSLSYEALGIGDGMAATIKWFRAATWDSMNDTERLQIFNDLQEYCELDTKAMVEIYNVLVELKTENGERRMEN